MQYKSVKGYSGFGQIGLIFLFTGFGFILAAIMQFAIGLSLVTAGTPLLKMQDEMMKALSDPKNINIIRLMQILSTFLMMGLPAYFFMRIVHTKNWLWLGFSKYINGQQVITGFFFIMFASMVAQPLADLSKYFVAFFPDLQKQAEALEKMYNDQVALMSNLKSIGGLLVSLVIIAFFPAVFEEMFFRGAIQNTLQRWWKGPVAAIIVTSVIFSFFHLSIYLFLSRFVLGLVLGWLFYKSKNIWVGIFIHFLNNTLALIQLYLTPLKGKKVEESFLDKTLPWWGIVICVVLLILFAYLFQKSSLKNANKIAVKEKILYESSTIFGSIASSNQSNISHGI